MRFRPLAIALVSLTAATARLAAQDATAAQRDAVAAAERDHGLDSLEAAAELLKLGRLLLRSDDPSAARQPFERALAIRIAKLSPDHPLVHVARIDAAAALLALDDPAAARPLLEEVRARVAPDAKGRVRTAALINLGTCDVKLGDYTAAAQALDEAIAALRDRSPDHPDLASALQNLAQVRLNQGKVEDARKLMEEAVAVIARAAPNSAQHAQLLYGQSMVLARTLQLDEAAQRLQQSIAIGTRVWPEGHPRRSEAEARLGWLECERGDLPAAREHLERALADADARPSSSRLGRHTMLARTLVRIGDLAAAAQQIDAATRIATTLAMPPLQMRDLLFARAELAAASPDRDAAIAAWQQVLDATRAVSHHDAQEARSALALALLDAGRVTDGAAALVDNLREFAAHLAELLPAMFEAERLRYVERHRGDLDRLLQCLLAHPQAVAARDVYAAVLAWKGQVGRGVRDQLAVAHANPDDLPRLRRLSEIAGEEAQGPLDAAVRRERERLLAALAPSSQPQVPAPAVAAVRGALAAEALLLDYVVYRGGDARDHLFVFAVSRDHVVARDLGPADPVIVAVQQHVRMAARSLAAGAERLARDGALAARAAVLDPVRDLLGDHTHLHVCPDGALATLPFETLPGRGEGTYLVEELSIDYLQSAVQLTAAPRAAVPEQIVAFGAIDYGDGPADAAGPRGAPRPFANLPQTAAEVAAIAAASDATACTVVRGGEATERRLRELAGRATVLHLATHGYYGVAAADAVDAGIALAGANRPPNVGDDGVLTAAEAALLDLRACRLVVLSACQSGLGTPVAGESLLGLRRSLHLAGAACTTTALWSVGDNATEALMRDFYRALLVDRAAPAAALRQAQLAALARARTECGEGLVGRWGAFVCEGR